MKRAIIHRSELSNGNILTNEGHIIRTKPVSSEPLPIEGKFGFSISKTGDRTWHSIRNVKQILSSTPTQL
ncbi:MAG: hypothetical protein IPI78_14715 [Chitinophagaceae bacterium]|nr:hypothetical protein [Chitinophagaceae bacterium]